MPTLDNQPDIDDVLQSELPAEPALPVVVTTPIRTHELPHKAGAAHTFSVGTGVSVKILPADHRRARAVITAVSNPILLSFVSVAAADGTTATFPLAVGALFTFTADTSLFAIAQTGVASVGILTELWAAGDD